MSFSQQAQYLLKFKCHFWWHVQHLVKFKCYFSWQPQYLVKFKRHFLWQAVLGEVEVSLFVADALREVQVLLFVAVGGEVQVSLSVAGAALGKCLSVTLGAKLCILQSKMHVVYSTELSSTFLFWTLVWV